MRVIIGVIKVRVIIGEQDVVIRVAYNWVPDRNRLDLL